MERRRKIDGISKDRFFLLDPQPDPDTLLQVHRNYAKHGLSADYRRRISGLAIKKKTHP